MIFMQYLQVEEEANSDYITCGPPENNIQSSSSSSLSTTRFFFFFEDFEPSLSFFLDFLLLLVEPMLILDSSSCSIISSSSSSGSSGSCSSRSLALVNTDCRTIESSKIREPSSLYCCVLVHSCMKSFCRPDISSYFSSSILC